MNNQQPNYRFYPTLLDSYQKFCDTKAEDYFYKDEAGDWHRNYSETEGTLHFSQEEVDALLEQELIDKINRVPQEPSEAADKGTMFNEILDCIITRKQCADPKKVIKTIKSYDDFVNAASLSHDLKRTEPNEDVFKRIGKLPFVYASFEGFEFYFDVDLCKNAAAYFGNSIAQYFTKANIETSGGLVELYGYIDYLKEDKVFDAKTTKKYDFGNYQKYWQRFVYPFTLIESEMMSSISSFEFSVFELKGGTSRSPLITGTKYKEVYTYDHERARKMITLQCERFIDFLELNRDKITNKKIFNLEYHGKSD